MRFLAAFLLFALSPVGGAVPLKLERFGGPAAEFKESVGVVEIHGSMPVLATPASAPGPKERVLEFEYFCVGGSPAFAILPGPPFEAKTSRMLPAISHSETWTTYAARIEPPDKPLPSGWAQLRLDFPLPAGRLLQIRKIQLREERPDEFEKIAASPAGAASEQVLQNYLDRKFKDDVSKVSVNPDLIRIEGKVGVPDAFLADIPMDVLQNGSRGYETLIAVKADANGAFKIDLPRHRLRGDLDHDRLMSRWQLVRKSDKGIEQLSHARYAEWIACRSPDLPPAKPANKKGLGGWHTGRLPDELEELGISAVTVNIMIHSLVSLTPGPDTTPIQWQGRTYHAREKALRELDETFLEAQKHHVMVSAILLVANPAKGNDPVVKILGHPDAVREGTFSMPNVTSAEGISLYGAILNLMAERWSRPDGKYGRVHHWIMHNEVDAGWAWTNAGEKTALQFMDLYQRSMRLMDLIARQYDPNARPFITLTHHWAHQGDRRWYGSKKLTDLLVRFGETEGDFPWGMAYHPYPQNLFNPRCWEDEQATYSFNTAKITPKNLEVLDAYMKQPRLLYHGKVRPVHFSENGFNSKDYSDKELEDQAAGMALAWKKIQELSSVESWQYHNWIDNRGEGGLKIGLRKFPDEPGDNYGRKPIWFLYRALGTTEENQVAAPYLKTIGLDSWKNVIHPVE